MENKLPKYIKGEFVVMRSIEELRAMNYKDDVLNYVRPLAGQVVIIDNVSKAADSYFYTVRKYKENHCVMVHEDFILCNANGRTQRELLECRNEIDSIIARDIHVAQLDTSKLNPSPMETWKALFASVESFFSLASPSMRAWAAGQLYGYSECLMQQITETPAEASATGKEDFNATLFLCNADDVLEYPTAERGKEFVSGKFKLKNGTFFRKYRIKSSYAVSSATNMGFGGYRPGFGPFAVDIKIREEGFDKNELDNLLSLFVGRRAVILYKGDRDTNYQCFFTKDIATSYVNFITDDYGRRYVRLYSERVPVIELKMKEEDFNDETR